MKAAEMVGMMVELMVEVKVRGRAGWKVAKTAPWKAG